MEDKKRKFTYMVANHVAQISFDYTLDCILGHSDSDYNLGNTGEEFEQNFEEDLLKLGCVVNERRLRKCAEAYDRIRKKLEKHIQAKYCNNPKRYKI